MFKTNKDIEYKAAPYGKIAVIPKGTEVYEATNLPQEEGKKQYWAEPWDGMDEQAESWQRNYGFLIEADEIDEVENIEEIKL